MPWEIDWSLRRRTKSNPQVWARNPTSSQKRARVWHWTTWMALRRHGIKWRPAKPVTLRYINKKGYVVLAQSGLSQSDKALCDRLGLWIGLRRGRRGGVLEHQLVAAKKYGLLPPGFLVRHLNGNKEDNRPENLVLGSHKDNSKDHHSALREMMYWRERAFRAEGMDLVEALK